MGIIFKKQLEESNNNYNKLKLLFKILISLTLFILAMFSSYRMGFNKGLDKMFFAVTDTMQTIINNQIKSDTSVTELIIINPDTNVYYLFNKTYNTKCIMSDLKGSFTEEDWNKLLDEIKADKEKQSGFFDLNKNTICTDNQHNPPSHLLVPPGKGYKHVCPRCGQIKIIKNQISYKINL